MRSCDGAAHRYWVAPVIKARPTTPSGHWWDPSATRPVFPGQSSRRHWRVGEPSCAALRRPSPVRRYERHQLPRGACRSLRTERAALTPGGACSTAIGSRQDNDRSTPAQESRPPPSADDGRGLVPEARSPGRVVHPPVQRDGPASVARFSWKIWMNRAVCTARLLDGERADVHVSDLDRVDHAYADCVAVCPVRVGSCVGEDR